MILISHRGNINGRNPNLENGQRYCQKAIDAGYNVTSTMVYYGQDMIDLNTELMMISCYKKKFGVTQKI